MNTKAGQYFALAWLVSLFLYTGAAQAVSLGKIEVTSFLGEPFHALVPVELEAAESISEITVEVAQPSDYRIFEVYRDEVLGHIRADVVSDDSGARVELVSDTALKAPFFNLILKTRQGRMTRFRKYPVFLEQPRPVIRKAVVRESVVENGLQATTSGDVQPPAGPVSQVTPVVERFDGWARTGRYGPIVRGDTLYTIAGRLRADSRYTRKQVMMALFEKNRDKFNMDNINLLKAGSFLDTPNAAEVEQISGSQAAEMFARHQQQWRELTKQPRYAAELEAQRTRYSKRITVGERLDGVAAAPVVVSSDSDEAAAGAARPEEKAAADAAAAESGPEKAAAASPAGTETASSGRVEDADEGSEIIASLRQENATLQKQLDESQKHIEALSLRIDSVTREATAASRSAVARLEVMVKQLQTELDNARSQAAAGTGSPDWLVPALAGVIALLLGVIVLMKRRESRPAPAAHGRTAENRATPAVPEKKSPAGSEGELQAQADEPIMADADTGEQDIDADEQVIRTTSEEMGPFVEAAGDQAGTVAEFLQEADTYMRYGMDDEALQQVNHALRIRPDSADAYIKKARILNSKGDSRGVEETVAAANSALIGVDLEHFSSALLDITGVSALKEGWGEKADNSEIPAVADDLVFPDVEERDVSALPEDTSLDSDDFVATHHADDLRLTPAHAPDEGQLFSDADDEPLAMRSDNEEGESDEGDATGTFDHLPRGQMEAAPSESGPETEPRQDDDNAGHALDLELEPDAAQELRSILDDFPDEGDAITQDNEQTDAQQSGETPSDVYELDINDNTTRELNDMLNDFSNLEPVVPPVAPAEEDQSESSDVSGERALPDSDSVREELDDLLSRFTNDEEEDEDKDKES